MIRAIVIGAVVGVGIALAPVAHADEDDTIDQPDLNGVVCDQFNLGQSPAQIAEDLNEGDGRRSIWDTTRTVWDALQEGC